MFSALGAKGITYTRVPKPKIVVVGCLFPGCVWKQVLQESNPKRFALGKRQVLDVIVANYKHVGNNIVFVKLRKVCHIKSP